MEVLGGWRAQRESMGTPTALSPSLGPATFLPSGCTSATPSDPLALLLEEHVISRLGTELSLGDSSES